MAETPLRVHGAITSDFRTFALINITGRRSHTEEGKEWLIGCGLNSRGILRSNSSF